MRMCMYMHVCMERLLSFLAPQVPTQQKRSRQQDPNKT